MVDAIITKLKGFVAKFRKSWSLMTNRERRYVYAGAAITLIGFFAGGAVGQAVFIGLIFNSLFWMMLHESNVVMTFMRKYGGKIDIAVTLSAIFFGGAGGMTMMMIGIVQGALFSVFRNIFCSEAFVSEPSAETVNPNMEPSCA